MKQRFIDRHYYFWDCIVIFLDVLPTNPNFNDRTFFGNIFFIRSAHSMATICRGLEIISLNPKSKISFAFRIR